MAHGEEHHEEIGHGGGRMPPTTIREYVYLGIFLTVVTFIEFIMVEEKHLFGATLIPLLIILTAAKFLVVVIWFMHLRWDHPLLRRTFTFGFLLASAILLALLALFWTSDTVSIGESVGVLIER
jgi:cytochrome c oxidase subunit IV